MLAQSVAHVQIWMCITLFRLINGIMSVISPVSPNIDYAPWFKSANESIIFFQIIHSLGGFWLSPHSS